MALTACLTSLCRAEGLAKYLNYRTGKFGFFLRGTYFVTNNAGLFSCASTTLSDLLDSDVPVSKINSRLGMSLYKSSLFENNWSCFFEQPERQEDGRWNPTSNPSCIPVHDWWSASYASLPITSVRRVVEHFFRPAAAIYSLCHKLATDYDIDFGNTIGVHYRGTDKSKEVKILPIQAFLDKTSQVLETTPSAIVFLLTDEREAATVFAREFPHSLVVNQSLRMSEGALGAHNVDSRDGQSQGQMFFATLLLVSKCRTLVTHTGNGALWEALFRGSSHGVLQLD